MQFGIMQGRLSPQYEERYQSHPRHHWQAEFYIAKEFGLELVEFVLDSWYFDENPLMHNPQEIQKVISDSGVGVKTICADYFMDYPFFAETQAQALKTMNWLMDHAQDLGVRDIVIPCVDRSSLKTLEQKEEMTEALRELTPAALHKGLRLNLETDLPPAEFRDFLQQVDSEALWVNYDIGNSSSLGFDPKEEFAAYGDRISDLHIKDRPKDSFSVELGTGDADFDFIIGELKQRQFQGPLIFQAARADNFVDDLVLLRKQIEFFKSKWGEN